jgi:hypothetical protein
VAESLYPAQQPNQYIMKRFPLYAALFAASFSFASCGGDNADGDVTDNDTAVLMETGDANTMNTDGSMNGTTGATMGSDMDEYGGTRNADGSVTYPDGVVRGSDGSMRRNGTVMTDVEVKEYESVRGKTITTDGTVKDRDGDGRVGTAEVKEEYKQGRDAVKDEYKDVKKNIKD